jgi:hypothetical protein
MGFAQSERITQTIDMFYLSLYRMPQGTCHIFMKFVWEINIETDEFSFRLYVSDIIPKFYGSHNRFLQIPVQWILLQRNVGHVYVLNPVPHLCGVTCLECNVFDETCTYRSIIIVPNAFLHAFWKK